MESPLRASGFAGHAQIAPPDHQHPTRAKQEKGADKRHHVIIHNLISGLQMT